MLISERIEKIIEEMLDDGNGVIEIKRNEFASSVGCVPSQINYVITSRFNKERGYIVESRRGGGGYIRIIRPSLNEDAYLMHLFGCIGDSIDSDSAVYLIRDMFSKGVITEREGKIIISILSDRNYLNSSRVDTDVFRANLLKSIILTLRY